MKSLTALEAATPPAIVHRDVKPANIFRHAPRSGEVLDFGLAKLAVSKSGGTVDGPTTIDAPWSTIG
jgi:serine/threonine protein kinase